MTQTSIQPAPILAAGRPWAVAAQGLVKQFPAPRKGDQPTAVLHGIDFAAGPGELVAIVGPSGSGKSTLLYCLSGLEPTTAGQVTLLGTDLARLNPDQQAKLRSQHVGFVFQRFNLIGSLNVKANVRLPAQLAGKRVPSRYIDDVIGHVGLAKREGFMPNELSGGEQQRVALARVLVSSPAIVFADEPTGSLDTATGKVVMGMLQETASRGACVVMVTHDLELAAMAHRVMILVDGRTHGHLQSPTPKQLLAQFESLKANA